MSDRANPYYTKYNYYSYYQKHKAYYRLNYLEKKRRDYEYLQYEQYLKDYFKFNLWIPKNLEEYKKNKILEDINEANKRKGEY